MQISVHIGVLAPQPFLKGRRCLSPGGTCWAHLQTVTHKGNTTEKRQPQLHLPAAFAADVSSKEDDTAHEISHKKYRTEVKALFDP